MEDCRVTVGPDRPPRILLTRRRELLPIATGLIALALAAAACGRASGSSSGGAPGGGGRGGGAAAPVELAAAALKPVPVDVQAIGNVEAYSTVSIKPQVSGQLARVHFEEGAVVRAGATLFTIDQAPYKAALEQAQANLTRYEALVTQADAVLAKDLAQADYAHSEIDRYDKLLARGLVSKELADQSRAAAAVAEATVKADRAAVASNRAQLEAGRAALETAKLQLSYTTIQSPMSGQTGNLPAKAGNIVTANVTELTTITQVEPIYLTFAVPAVNLPAIKRYQAEGTLQVLVTPQDDSAKPSVGTLTFIDNTVDVNTDTIRLKATVPNEDRRLWPGQFARVVLRLTTLPQALVVPADALQTGQDGQFVFVVTKDMTVDLRPVKAGTHVGQDVVIEQGLQAGEQVVTEGQVRLEPGTKVQLRGREAQTPTGRGTGRGGGRRSGAGRSGPGGVPQ